MKKVIPPHRHPNIVRIWDDVYRVLVRAGEVDPIDDPRQRSMYSSGNRHIDEAQKRAIEPIYVSIDDMLEYFKTGVQVRLTREEDAVKIFDALMDHVSEWRAVIMTQLHTDDAPVDDFILMEQFAASVYDIAKFKLHEGTERERRLRHLQNGASQFGGMRMMSTLTSSKDPVQVAARKSVKSIEYKPNIDAFQRAVLNRSSYGTRNY